MMHINNANDPCRFIDFSGATYQMQLVDPDTQNDVWTFIQLGPQGEIIDGFCDQEETEGTGICIHLKTALDRIYHGHTLPLHLRFENSLWNRLCLLAKEHFGLNRNNLKRRGKGDYACYSSSGKAVFRIKAKTNPAYKYLKELLVHRHTDTEETSLKFSNLSQEELMLWREGNPSTALEYELSFWSDLAKWLMLLQDSGENYSISFDYSSSGLPNVITVAFNELEMTFYISAANLPSIIPSLADVRSPLTVHHAPADEIEEILYDKEKGTLQIVPKLSALESKIHPKLKDKGVGGIPLNGWLFVPGDGFYARDPHELLQKKVIASHELSQFLNDHTALIKKLLRSASLHEEVVKPSYSIAFDTDWNLHIVTYLFSSGDLSAPGSHSYGDWAYIDDDGFYRVDKGQFNALETIVQQKDVPDFISQNRTWLNAQEGFNVFLTGVESRLIYHLSNDDKLSFTCEISARTGSGESKEFGSWVYLMGEGFYAKNNSLTGLAQINGLILNREQIPLFIKANRDELTFVTGFFSPRTPVRNAGIVISMDDSNLVDIAPQYDLLDEYKVRKVKFFDDYSYVEGEGFHELPLEKRLPERFRHIVHLRADELELFLLYEMELIKPYIEKIDPRLVKPDHMQLVAASPSQLETASGGYQLKFIYETSLGSLPATTLWTALRSKKRFLFSDAGLIDLHDKRYNWLRWLNKKQIDKRTHAIQLSTIELIRLNSLENVEIRKHKGREDSPAEKLLAELEEFRTPEDPTTDGLKSSLRPYQFIGLKWLWFLHRHRLSGLLCDDMGLGKTHQTMGLMAAIKNKSPEKAPLPILVICPTSVIYHWQEKLHAFLPGARVYTFYGAERTLDNFVGNFDVLLTSYGVFRMESERISKMTFELAIFDEVQVAKNHNSRIYASLLLVNAHMRLGLTGTPIENNLRELKALFDIVLPLYMPIESDFREMFVKPIEREGDRLRQMLLTRLIKPFVMRRKKEDVLLDLPEKMEEVSHCDLDPEQVKLYNDVLISQRERLIRDLENDSSPIPYMHIFALLSALKQICDHPAVYLKCPENYRKYRSGKWDLFVELLTEARESSQKVVVYSQYLFMLDIIEEYLNENGIGFAGIRGATVNRGEQLMRFEKDPKCEVFVASLQAAGLGIDLTSASVVIHYDRWWNAAREDQATDRVHRIGQTRGVQVFKLVTKDTFEERIDELIENKRKLMEEVVTADDHETVKQFTRHELMLFLKETHSTLREEEV